MTPKATTTMGVEGANIFDIRCLPGNTVISLEKIFVSEVFADYFI